MTSDAAELERTRRSVSPRYAPPAVTVRALLMHGGVALLWVLLFARSFGASGLASWSVGLAYIGYDTALLVFVFVQTLGLLRRARPCFPASQPRLAVVVAARNEASVLPVCLAAIFAQSAPADEVIIADDGSNDATGRWLCETYGLVVPDLGTLSEPGPVRAGLRWLRLPHGGKARALNAALGHVKAEVVLTVDADTLLDQQAVSAMRTAFAEQPALVAATGLLFPVCSATRSGQVLQWFQRYEYMRNFLSRYAWARQDGLLLISGAFAAYRRSALLAVGGFETDCLVEDYELTHRLLYYAAGRGLDWRTDVIGAARAQTDAPGTPAAFLRQRRRWFGGFLQTQVWYRDMVGNPAFGRLGTMMLPVKAIDTMQPIYGLTSIVMLAIYAGLGNFAVVSPVAGVVGAKIGLDLMFYLWSLWLYRRWAGPAATVRIGSAIVAALIEPFTFQVLRHTGAALGWVSFLTREQHWATPARTGIGRKQGVLF